MKMELENHTKTLSADFEREMIYMNNKTYNLEDYKNCSIIK